MGLWVYGSGALALLLGWFLTPHLPDFCSQPEMGFIDVVSINQEDDTPTPSNPKARSPSLKSRASSNYSGRLRAHRAPCCSSGHVAWGGGGREWIMTSVLTATMPKYDYLQCFGHYTT